MAARSMAEESMAGSITVDHAATAAVDAAAAAAAAVAAAAEAAGSPADAAPCSLSFPIVEFCQLMGGSRPIQSVLIANNGIAAVKFIRSIRSWAYESFGMERAVQLVAMASPEDMRANLEHIQMADSFVEVPGGSNNNNYANVRLIVEIAERTRVDAVWPGWGHASENPELPEELHARGIVFLGPPAAAMAALGDKIGSSLIAQAAGVPTLPWSGSNVMIPPSTERAAIPDDVYCQACVQTAEEAAKSCNLIGYPVMIKASWGGGGRGIRKVHNEEEVRSLFKQVQGEVPGSPIFVMKVASQSRHLEVQLVCDSHGNVASLHSRDCSIQRRHQKIIEEGPITVASADVIKSLEAGARRLAASVGFVGVATVEFLFEMERGEFFFLELNPRLQVEHPVTEWIAAVNIPSIQLCIGMGIPLWKMPEICRFFSLPHGGPLSSWRHCASLASPFDSNSAASAPPKGHVVAVRVTSEDPDDGFKPTSGRVQELSFRGKPDVWAYFSIKAGGRIHEFSDSQFGHLFAFGETRPLAIANMVLALKGLQIRGEMRTIVDYAVDLLQDPEYLSNKIHTGWLDSRIAMRVKVQRPPWHVSVITGAVHLATRLTAARIAEYIGYLEKGQIPPTSVSLVNFEVALNIDNCKYKVLMARLSPSRFLLSLNRSEVQADAHLLPDGGLLVQLDGSSHVVYAEEEAAGTRLLIGGRTCLLQNDHDPSQLIAETPCKLLRHLVDNNAHLSADQVFAEVEVMKMCMPLLAPAAGRICWLIPEGQALQAGDLIATLRLDDPTAVKKSEDFEGELPRLGTPTGLELGNEGERFAEAVGRAKMILAGYEHEPRKVVDQLQGSLGHPSLPLLQWQEAVSILATRLPVPLKAELDAAFRRFQSAAKVAEAAGEPAVEFPFVEMRGRIEAHVASLSARDQQPLQQQLSPLLKIIEGHSKGRQHFTEGVVSDLLDSFLQLEEMFSLVNEADAIEQLRQQHKKDLSKVVDAVLSHQSLPRKLSLVKLLLDLFVAASPESYESQLRRLTALPNARYGEVAATAKQLLQQLRLRSLKAGLAKSFSEQSMEQSMAEKDNAESSQDDAAPGLIETDEMFLHAVLGSELRMEQLVQAPVAIEDALAGLFHHADVDIRKKAIETYVKRVYEPYLVEGSVAVAMHPNESVIATWQFWEELPPPTLDSLEHIPSPPPASLSSSTFRGIQRWGLMAVAPSPALIREGLKTALADAREWSLLAPQLPHAAPAAAARGGGAETAGPGGVDAQAGARRMRRIRTFMGTPSGVGNVIHVALVPGAAGEADASNESRPPSIGSAAVGKGLGTLEQQNESLRIEVFRSAVMDPDNRDALRKAGVTAVSCLLVEAEEWQPPLRHCFHWSESAGGFEERRLLRHVEPPLAGLLELSKLLSFPNMSYSTSRDGRWHIYSTNEGTVFRAFLRSVLRLPQPPKPSPKATSPSPHPPHSSLQPDPSVPPPNAATSSDVLSSFGLTVVEMVAAAMTSATEDLKFASTKQTAASQLVHVHVFMAVLRPMALSTLFSNEEEDDEKEEKEGHRHSRHHGHHSPVNSLLSLLATRINAALLLRLKEILVSQWELRLQVKSGGSNQGGAWRLVVNNRGDHASVINVYREAEDAESSQLVYVSVMPVVSSSSEEVVQGSEERIFAPIRVEAGSNESLAAAVVPEASSSSSSSLRSQATDSSPLHLTPLSAAYSPLTKVEKKRLVARRNGTTFCYDFLLLFESALASSWNRHGSHDLHQQPTTPDRFFFQSQELVFQDPNGTWDEPLVSSNRPPGENSIGMVAWKLQMATPACPQGRSIFVVANDVTHGAGSFGVKEDAFFRAVTLKACQEKLPLIYIAANSGARIGIAEELKTKIQVAWVDKSRPERGFKYLFLSDEDYGKLQKSVRAEPVQEEGEEIRWKLTDIIGAQDGLGVENLSGSGAIAGAFAKAYKEIFTLTFVSGRTVGIGAYLARLGVRCIQRADQPIILTGFSALNKLLGRNVYSSHMQLGGPRVMAENGVVHSVVQNDLEGVASILSWLDFVPPFSGGPLSITVPSDPPTRPVEYIPENFCDPRAAVRGTIQDVANETLRGIFDEGSFVETFESWAQTVVVGRARLGGIPMGVIAVETATVLQHIPADPGQPDSQERFVPKAGQVWFPDSASKTAQAIQDFNLEGLPLFILANWRGFSGGQRDLFEGVLQAGAAIVENLRTFLRPVVVYIPRHGELRGGAWVVVDHRINPGMVEMYADDLSRGAVLEPEGVVEIKFRKQDVVDCMHRLDAELKSMDGNLKILDGQLLEAKRKATEGTTGLESSEVAELGRQIAEVRAGIAVRERSLLPVYNQMAVQFAELHDTPVRMKAKEVIRKIVPWVKSRGFFFHRLRLRLLQEELMQEMLRLGWIEEKEEALNKFKEMMHNEETSFRDKIEESDELWREDAEEYEALLNLKASLQRRKDESVGPAFSLEFALSQLKRSMDQLSALNKIPPDTSKVAKKKILEKVDNLESMLSSLKEQLDA